jgi:hypothetical protein
MGKTFVSVNNPQEFEAVFVSECEDGCIGWATSASIHYTLEKNYTGLPVVGSVTPHAGAPIAGSPNALWYPFGG